MKPSARLSGVILSGAIVLAAFAGTLSASAQTVPCVPSEMLGSVLSQEAQRIGAAVETLEDTGEISRYIAVINEEPPPAGPADSLLILVHPTERAARVFLVHRGNVCERYLIGPQLHRKAWAAARGVAT